MEPIERCRGRSRRVWHMLWDNRFFCKHANETACAASDYLYQKSKGGAKWISQDWPLFRAPALRRRRLPAGTPPPRVANSSLPAASSHPCHMTRPPSLLPPSPPPSKAPPALRPPSYLIDAATNATSSILCRCSGEAPSPRSPPALLTASERRRGRVLVCPRFP